jgi:spore germination protein GerM
MKRRRPLRLWVAAAVVAALGVAGCSVPEDSTARIITSNQLRDLAAGNQSLCPVPIENPRTVHVYVVSQKEEGARPVLTRVERSVGVSSPDAMATPSDALKQLLACRVTDDERSNKGLSTFIPQGTQTVTLVKVHEGDYDIQLPALTDENGKQVDDLPLLAVAQLVFTATENEQYDADHRVYRVKFSIDFEPVAVRTESGGKKKDEWVTRDDFPTSRPTTTTTSPTTTAATTTTTTTTAPPPPTTTVAPTTTRPR